MGIENGIEYEHPAALFRSEELSAKDQCLLRDILHRKNITKDCTCHALLSAAVDRGVPLTPGQIRKARQCDACMKERSIVGDETALHVAKGTKDSEKQYTRQPGTP